MAGITRLRDREFNGYLRRRIPHLLDNLATSAVEEYLAGDATVREAIVNAVDARVAGVLSAFGQRMAVVAVRRNSSEPLTLGLVAAGISNPLLEDPRDNLRVLAALNDAAERVGQQLTDVLRRVRNDVPDASFRDFMSFCERTPRDKSLRAMGMGAAGVGEAFLYVSHPT
ncbi:hypothetical protein ABH920_007292 [Catenulispora sp. EB89]|uniref:hypothetical protein n=1 Tax=Catenulispora sp. EB89 TaxID=3156257 RepID=UPI0035151C7F